MADSWTQFRVTRVFHSTEVQIHICTHTHKTEGECERTQNGSIPYMETMRTRRTRSIFHSHWYTKQKREKTHTNTRKHLCHVFHVHAYTYTSIDIKKYTKDKRMRVFFVKNESGHFHFKCCHSQSTVKRTRFVAFVHRKLWIGLIFMTKWHWRIKIKDNKV